jgi:hypothetical protein
VYLYLTLARHILRPLLDGVKAVLSSGERYSANHHQSRRTLLRTTSDRKRSCERCDSGGLPRPRIRNSLAAGQGPVFSRAGGRGSRLRSYKSSPGNSGVRTSRRSHAGTGRRPLLVGRQSCAGCANATATAGFKEGTASVAGVAKSDPIRSVIPWRGTTTSAGADATKTSEIAWGWFESGTEHVSGRRQSVAFEYCDPRLFCRVVDGNG